MKTKLLGGLAVKLDDGTVLLRLRDAELGPKRDNVVGKSLNGRDAARVFLVDACELGVKGVDVVWRKVESRRDGLFGVCWRKGDLDESRLKMR